MNPPKVLGIGGIFLTSKDPAAARAWYRQHLGLDIQDWGGLAFDWATPDRPGFTGQTIWSMGTAGTDYFAPGKANFMVNYVVADVRALIAQMKADGATVIDKIEESEYGIFGWAIDPDGNKIELWQPPSLKPAQ
ncbi:MAG TPA: glyoxalase [Alphaproteobacteria bacterium]|nr:glyoxalase [Alphaproteobacteria bacterium]HAJ47857.1 glyoxalase [Alphaproteobacteria bacterium]